jgi:hypothetical protein
MPITNLHKRKKTKNIVVGLLVIFLFSIIFTVTIQKLTPKKSIQEQSEKL